MGVEFTIAEIKSAGASSEADLIILSPHCCNSIQICCYRHASTAIIHPNHQSSQPPLHHTLQRPPGPPVAPRTLSIRHPRHIVPQAHVPRLQPQKLKHLWSSPGCFLPTSPVAGHPCGVSCQGEILDSAGDRGDLLPLWQLVGVALHADGDVAGSFCGGGVGWRVEVGGWGGDRG